MMKESNKEEQSFSSFILVYIYICRQYEPKICFFLISFIEI